MVHPREYFFYLGNAHLLKYYANFKRKFTDFTLWNTNQIIEKIVAELVPNGRGGCVKNLNFLILLTK